MSSGPSIKYLSAQADYRPDHESSDFASHLSMNKLFLIEKAAGVTKYCDTVYCDTEEKHTCQAEVEIYYKVPDKSVKNSKCLVLFHDCRTHCPTASISLISMRLIGHINSSCHAFVRNNTNYCLNSWEFWSLG